MQVIPTRLSGVVILEPVVFSDARGCFSEVWSQRVFDASVRPVRFVQDNESRSVYGVVRGLHYQKGVHSQGNLIRVVQGRVRVVAVDLRRGSPTFGEWVAVELSGENHRQLFVPRGFAHGFSVLSEEAVFQYKCDNYYAPGEEAGIAWDDPDLAIDWGIPAKAVLLSGKDRRNPRLSQAQDLFDYGVDYYAF